MGEGRYRWLILTIGLGHILGEGRTGFIALTFSCGKSHKIENITMKALSGDPVRSLPRQLLILLISESVGTKTADVFQLSKSQWPDPQNDSIGLLS